MNARVLSLGGFHLGVIIEGKATDKDVELVGIAARATAYDGLSTHSRCTEAWHRPRLSCGLCAARLAELHRALCASEHHAVEPGHRPEHRSSLRVRPAHDSLRRRRAARRRHRAVADFPALD